VSTRTGGPEEPTPTPDYCELVLAGDAEVCRGLIVGLQIGCGEAGSALIGHEEELEHGSLGETLRELVTGKGRLTHFVVSRALTERLREQLPRLEREAGLRLAAERAVRGGRFRFAVHAFTRPQAAEIKALLAALPAGARLLGYTEHEKVDPAARGVEAYAPVHEYELKGEGAVEGTIAAVLDARRRLTAQPLISAERIELVEG